MSASQRPVQRQPFMVIKRNEDSIRDCHVRRELPACFLGSVALFCRQQAIALINLLPLPIHSLA